MTMFESVKNRIMRVRNIYFKNIWDAITWLVWASLVLWIIAKALGWIDTPLSLELYPYIAIAFFVERLSHNINEFKTETKSELKEIRNELHQHEIRIIKLETKLT